MNKVNGWDIHYNDSGNLASITDPIAGVIRRTYDDCSNLISIQDPNNGITYYLYDKNYPPHAPRNNLRV